MRYALALCLAGCVAGSAPAAEGTAWLKVLLPADAELWVGDFQSQQTGSERNLKIDDLDDSYEYAYTVYARLYRGGYYYTQSRKVWVTPGYEYTVRLSLDYFQAVSSSSYNSSSSYSSSYYSSRGVASPSGSFMTSGYSGYTPGSGAGTGNGVKLLRYYPGNNSRPGNMGGRSGGYRGR